MIRVKNLEKFQHYKNRRPPWIKLHRSVLEDYHFRRLPDAAKAHAMLLWIVASGCDNALHDDISWLREITGATTPIDVDILVSAGFLERYDDEKRKRRASKPLAERKQSADSEGEERERRDRGRGDRRKYPHFPDDLRVAFRDAWRAKIGVVPMDRLVRDLAPIFDRPESEWDFTRDEALRAIGFGWEWAQAADRRGRKAYEVPNFTPAKFAGQFTRYLGYVREGMANPDGTPTSYALYLDVPSGL